MCVSLESLDLVKTNGYSLIVWLKDKVHILSILKFLRCNVAS